MRPLRCVVEDNKDPKYWGRVRIRVLGVHSPRTDEVKTEELPWSNVLNPLDACNTLGSSTNILVGTWGYCIPLNDNLTEFLFLGTIKGTMETPDVTDSDGNSIGFRDPDGTMPVRPGYSDNPLTYGDKLPQDITRSRVQVDSFDEPADTAHLAEYPKNKVYEDLNGNIVEIDSTKNNSRIRIQHSSGARLEINNKGDITIQASEDGNIYQETPGLFALGADGNFIFQGDVKVKGNIECTQEISATGNITSKGDIADSEGNLSSLRAQHDINIGIFNAHIHTDPQGGEVAPTLTLQSTDPVARTTDFVWIGNPK